MYKQPAKKEKQAENASKETSKSGESLHLEDKRTSSTVQRKVQHLMQNYVPKNVIQPKKNTTGIPDKLKSGIEDLSGVSLNDVKVHYNSSKPAQLNAYAYAKGNAIHLASGQEKHLPHEAWHVVQQKQGRVKPTIQTKENVAINDDQNLEKEADIMGTKAMQLKVDDTNADATPKESSSDIVQRQIIPYNTKYKGPLAAKYKNAVEGIVSSLDNLVQQAYKQSLHWQSLSGNQDKFVQNWFKLAQGYATDPSGKEPKLMYARFGYSIEAIATAGLNNKSFGSLVAKTQVSHGHTRPDIVLLESSSKTEVAWIDITSIASIGHIDGKDGAGWANRPFIFEIVYPKLQMHALLNATKNPYYKELGALVSSEKQIELDTKLKNENELRKQFISHRDSNEWTTGSHNATTKRKATRDFFMSEAANEGVEEESKSMKNTKGALEHLGINSGPFGFNRGDVKSTNDRIKQVIDAKSEQEIQQTQGQLYYATSKRILQELHTKIPQKMFEKFFEQLHVTPQSKDVSLALMAMKGIVLDHDHANLSHAIDAIKSFTDIVDPRAKTLEKEITELLKGPQGITHQIIMTWRHNATQKIQEAHNLCEISKVRTKLREYAKLQGWNLMNRPQQITTWFQQLAATPLNINAANAAKQWLNNPQPF